MKKLTEARSFDGLQSVYEHDSDACRCVMRFAVYAPPRERATGEALLWLSGLTCTHENFIAKAGAQRVASELGLTLLVPDTSPRGDHVPDDPDGGYDLGLGAGFYLDATEDPWAKNYRMRTYIEKEFLPLAIDRLGVDPARVGISGHSMGGHGALTMALRNPDVFRSVSALAPIAAPSEVPWGEKAYTAYLGGDQAAWRAYDASALLDDGARFSPHVDAVLIDQGAADEFLDDQLRPQRFKAACDQAGVKAELRVRPGYDHSYYFVATFISDHLRWHASRL
ncbi:MAG: S-formylglutathione hydrolase [Pseudomonadota bacterium]